jgi:acyl carrier protein
MDISRLRDSIRSWLEANAAVPDFERPIADDTHLVDAGILTSLSIAQFVVYLEQLGDRPLDLDMLEADAFRSINNVLSTFFADVEA